MGQNLLGELYIAGEKYKGDIFQKHILKFNHPSKENRRGELFNEVKIRRRNSRSGKIPPI